MLPILLLLLLPAVVPDTLTCSQFPTTWDCATEGQRCTPGQACASGLACITPSQSSSSICMKSNIGAPCTQDDNCYPVSNVGALLGSSVKCSGYESGSTDYNKVCTVQKFPGQSCKSDSECLPNGLQSSLTTGRCVQGTCFVGQQWNPCQQDSDCYNSASNTLNANSCGASINGVKTCQTRVGLGLPCLTTRNPQNCQAGLVCQRELCAALPTAGQLCPDGQCFQSTCLSVGGGVQCTRLLSVATGGSVCNPNFCSWNDAQYCQSMNLDIKTGKCIDYAPPASLGQACDGKIYNGSASCQTATDPRASCICTANGPDGTGTCVLQQYAGGLPFAPTCATQHSTVISSCGITNSLTEPVTPPYTLSSDGLSSCCTALNEYFNCLSSASYSGDLKYGDSFLRCGNNILSNIRSAICGKQSVVFNSASSLAPSSVLLLLLSFVAALSL